MSQFIQVNLVDGRSLYTDWGHLDYNDSGHRIRAFRSHLDNKYDSTFNARRRFVKGAPVYLTTVHPQHVVSISMVADGWEDVLDEGQIPVYLYDDEIRALINNRAVHNPYEPPALIDAYDRLMQVFDNDDDAV